MADGRTKWTPGQIAHAESLWKHGASAEKRSASMVAAWAVPARKVRWSRAIRAGKRRAA
jgi:hypothetical protein